MFFKEEFQINYLDLITSEERKTSTLLETWAQWLITKIRIWQIGQSNYMLENLANTALAKKTMLTPSALSYVYNTWSWPDGLRVVLLCDLPAKLTPPD